jgi:hypothetical protein
MQSRSRAECVGRNERKRAWRSPVSIESVLSGTGVGVIDRRTRSITRPSGVKHGTRGSRWAARADGCQSGVRG